MNNTPNPALRILVVDDEPSILDSYRIVLCPPAPAGASQQELTDLAAKLFDAPHPPRSTETSLPADVDLVLCRQGHEAVEAVRAAFSEQRPFAVAFLDMRMPPGPDGVWTAEQIRALDPYLQIVMVTAYSDVDPAAIAARVRPPDKLLYVQKPFHAAEIRQFVTALAAKWTAEKNIRCLTENLESQVNQRTAQLQKTNEQLQQEVMSHQQAQQALQESEAFRRTILDNALTGIIAVDPDTHQILEANSHALQMIGASRDQVIGRLCHNFICPAGQGKCPVTDLGQRIDLSERVLLRTDGKEIPILKSVSCVQRQDQKYLIESFVDITYRKEAEAALQQQNLQISETRDVAIFALAKLAESRDPETGEHLERLCGYSRLLADQLGREGPYRQQVDAHFQDTLFRSSPLHDIGKVGIPDMILLKPGRLTASEFKIMQQHSVIGADALDEAVKKGDSGGFLAMGAAIARYHHERFDGSGYPTGLKGEDIPLAARIVAVADVFDALTSARVYKAAFRSEVARLMIQEEAGKHFDPIIVEAFLTRFDDILKIRDLPEIHNSELTAELVSADARR